MGTLRMRDLIAATGVGPRVVRQYIQRGLLPHADGRGTGPVYSDEHLVRLRAIRSLLAQRFSLDEIKRRLARLSPEAVAQLGAARPATGSATPGATATPSAGATKPAAAATPSAGATEPAATTTPTTGAADPGTARTAPAAANGAPLAAERWERVVLLPGLELHVRSDAGPLVRRLAEEIHGRYSAAAPGG